MHIISIATTVCIQNYLHVNISIVLINTCIILVVSFSVYGTYVPFWHLINYVPLIASFYSSNDLATDGY